MLNILLYFFVFFVIQVSSSFFVESLWALFTGSRELTAGLMITMTSVSHVATIIIFTLLKWTPFSMEFFRRKGIGGGAGTILYWCVIAALGMLIPTMCIEELIPEAMRQDNMADTFKTIMQSPWGYLSIALLAPVAEELVFRGAIQKTAVKYYEGKFGQTNRAHWIAIVVSAALFAAVHGNPAQIPHALLIGMLLGWLCYRTGSIIPGIIVHWVNNSAAFSLYHFYPRSYDMSISEFFGDSTLRLSGAVVLSLLLFIPALWQLHKTMEKS